MTPSALTPDPHSVDNDKANQPRPASDDASAMRNGIKPGPAPSPTQVRPSGPDAMRDKPADWDKTDESSDESFPASDPPARY
ncbi:MAG: hypothetical protein ACO1OK_03690 [Devosia sp.]